MYVFSHVYSIAVLLFASLMSVIHSKASICQRSVTTEMVKAKLLNENERIRRKGKKSLYFITNTMAMRRRLRLSSAISHENWVIIYLHWHWELIKSGQWIPKLVCPCCERSCYDRISMNSAKVTYGCVFTIVLFLYSFSACWSWRYYRWRYSSP